QDVRWTIAPPGGHDHHAQAIRPECFRKRTAAREPAANEAPARLLRPLVVDRAAALAAEVARHAFLHLVAANRAFHPAIAARRASATLTLFDRRQRYHRATALLVFFSAAARTWIVSSHAHFAALSILVPLCRISFDIEERGDLPRSSAGHFQLDRAARQQGGGFALRARSGRGRR